MRTSGRCSLSGAARAALALSPRVFFYCAPRVAHWPHSYPSPTPALPQPYLWALWGFHSLHLHLCPVLLPASPVIPWTTPAALKHAWVLESAGRLAKKIAIPRISGSRGLKRGPRMCISNNFQAMLMLLVQAFHTKIQIVWSPTVVCSACCGPHYFILSWLSHFLLLLIWSDSLQASFSEGFSIPGIRPTSPTCKATSECPTSILSPLLLSHQLWWPCLTHLWNPRTHSCQ